MVGSLELIRRDLAPLAAQVSNLARLWLGRVTGGVFPSHERVEVSERRSAVSVLGNRVDVDVVGWNIILAWDISTKRYKNRRAWVTY